MKGSRVEKEINLIIASSSEILLNFIVIKQPSHEYSCVFAERRVIV